MRAIGNRFPAVMALLSVVAAALAAAPVAAQKPEPLRLVLNVPENRLYVYEDGEQTHRFRVSVGLPGYETPAGRYRITEAIWNPWWHPPESEWARGREVEPPGPKNPMGRIKLHFGPLLYIHGTPDDVALGQPASRGCVRMDNRDAIALARIVHRYATPDISPALFDRLLSEPEHTRAIALSHAVPLRVVYRVSAVRNDRLFIFPDVYGRVGEELANEVREVLKQNGVDLDRVDPDKLSRLVRKGLTHKVSMPLDTLLTGGSIDADDASGTR